MAGIVAGDRDYQESLRGGSRIQGVAPKAQILSYKVLTALGSGSATNIILMNASKGTKRPCRGWKSANSGGERP